jgi:hypothetical protein
MTQKTSVNTGEDKEARVKARIQAIVAGMLAVGLIVGLSACMGHWFTPPQVATLIVGDPVASGGKWKVLISVANMPNGGLASMAVDADGITYNNAKISNIVATGLNGSTVLASEFDDATGKGRFVIANLATGSVGGTILEFTFDTNATVTSADLGSAGFDKTKITLGSDINTLITTWSLGTTKAYYAK